MTIDRFPAEVDQGEYSNYPIGIEVSHETVDDLFSALVPIASDYQRAINEGLDGSEASQNYQAYTEDQTDQLKEKDAKVQELFSFGRENRLFDQEKSIIKANRIILEEAIIAPLRFPARWLLRDIERLEDYAEKAKFALSLQPGQPDQRLKLESSNPDKSAVHKIEIERVFCAGLADRLPVYSLSQSPRYSIIEAQFRLLDPRKHGTPYYSGHNSGFVELLYPVLDPMVASYDFEDTRDRQSKYPIILTDEDSNKTVAVETIWPLDNQRFRKTLI